MFAFALAAVALQVATPELPQGVPPPCSHLWMAHFDPGSAALSPRAEAMLDNFAVPDVRWGLTTKIVVAGHADTVGGEGPNLALSRRRAEAVSAYLVRMGIKPSRIEIVAVGERDLTVKTPDNTPSAYNRVVRVIEQVPPEEMARRKAAWSAFANVVC